jgi:hypothetical protein
MTTKTTAPIWLTAEEFERWVSQQMATGFVLKSPEALEAIRAELKRRPAGHLQAGTITHEQQTK